MERQLSGSPGLDVSTPPGTTEICLQLGHSNLYIKNLPAMVDEPELWQLFSRCGSIEAARVVRSKAQTSKGYGFVKFGAVSQAIEAIRTFNGYIWDQHQLEVKFADQDAGPPSSGSGGTPSDNLYIRNLPNNWGDVELAHLFAQYGTVLECRMLHNGDMTRGAGALVRMSTMQQATAAIDSLNNVGNGVGLPLLVRYADTQEEKARKLAKKAVVPPASHSPFDLLQSIAAGHYQMIDGMHPGLPAGFTAFSASGVPDGNGSQQTPLSSRHYPDGASGYLAPLDPCVQSPFTEQGPSITTPTAHTGLPGSFSSNTPYPNLSQDIHNSIMSASPPVLGLNLGGLASTSPMHVPGLGLDVPLGSQSMSLSSQNSGIATSGCFNLLSSHALSQSTSQSMPCSLYVKNLPAEADRLFLYEKFAPHGAVYSVKILSDEQNGKCRGVGFINYGDAKGAIKAVEALHGSKIQDKVLHVSFQTHRGRPLG